jgi:transposase
MMEGKNRKKRSKMSYPVTFRKKVLQTMAEKSLSRSATSRRFGIAIKTINKWMIDITIKKTRNKKPTKIDSEALRKDVEMYPDHYARERAQRFGVSANGIWSALKRLKITYKKNPKPPKSGSRKKIYLYPRNRSLEKSSQNDSIHR